MKPIYIFSIFVVVVLAQLFIPSKMIFDQESVITNGTAYKFRTQPIDPSDPFKGKYIYLNYDINSFPSTDSTWAFKEDIYVSLKTDTLGFARVSHISRNVPDQGDYLKTQVDWYNVYDKKVTFTFPFNEFYMNEDKAYNAEVAHRKAQRDSLPNNTYALIYILNGKGVLGNVFINDIPIAKYVED